MKMLKAENALISVVIPTYNREKTILRAIQSVMYQTYENLEILIIDDASTDKTKEIVNQIQDKRIRYIQLEKNSGASHARNIGIEMASGTYITFHDSDDFLHLNKLQIQLDYLLNTASDMVFCQVNRFDLEGNKLGVFPEKWRNRRTKQDVFHSFLLQGVVWTQAIFGNANAVKSILFDEEMKCRVDMDYAIRFAEKYKVTFQKVVLVDSYVQSNSISQNRTNFDIGTGRMYMKYKKYYEGNKKVHAIWKLMQMNYDFRNSQCTPYYCWAYFCESRDIRWLLKSIIVYVR